MNLKPVHKSAILAAISVVSIIIAYLSLSQSWYHHDDWRYYSYDDSSWGEEEVYYLDEWTSTRYSENYSEVYNYTYYESYSSFWLPREPIHSFMGTIETLIFTSIAVAAIVAALAFFRRYQTVQLIVTGASVALFASVPIAFFLGFVDAVNDSELPGLDELTSFMGDKTTVENYLSYREYREVWGPTLGWWLLLIACAVQCVGLFFALKLREK